MVAIASTSMFVMLLQFRRLRRCKRRMPAICCSPSGLICSQDIWTFQESANHEHGQARAASQGARTSAAIIEVQIEIII